MGKTKSCLWVLDDMQFSVTVRFFLAMFVFGLRIVGCFIWFVTCPLTFFHRCSGSDCT